jgi:transcriptional regulator of acetoin/glycerol metabolism
VRELLNFVERAAILCRGTEIRPEHLPPGLLARPESPLIRSAGRRELKPEALADVLSRHGGNHTSAALELGVHRTTLWRWSKRP